MYCNFSYIKASGPNDQTSGVGQCPEPGKFVAANPLPTKNIGTLIFERGKLTDFKILANGVILEAHMVVLAAMSPVFDAMVMRNTKERNLGLVNIPDIQLDTLEELLKFCYSGEAPPILCASDDG